MPLENAPLKYLFTAVYDDGTECAQTPEDVSKTNPLKSAFYDVLNSGKKVAAFVLKSVDGATQAAVSMEDGHFELNGSIFFPGELPEQDGEIELIYLRRNFRHFNLALEQEAHVIHYHLGWRMGDVERKIVLM